MNGFAKESDWKLLRKKISKWQETYIDKLNKEYAEILCTDKNPSEKFWELEKRINKDKQSIGVKIDMCRSKMDINILDLLRDGVITLEDLAEFSDELKEKMTFIMSRNCR